MKKNILLFLNFLILFSLQSQTANISLSQVIKKIKTDKDLAHGFFGFYAIDLSNNKVIGENNSEICLKPASTQKLFTTSAALILFGPDKKFETKILYDGQIDKQNRTLNGNIYIQGGGDPTLCSKYFDNSTFAITTWVQTIKNLGIDTINGAIIGDASIFSDDIVPPTWAWEDIGNYFGSGPCGLSIFDNSYTLFFNTSSYSGGKTSITKMEPDIPQMTFENTVKAANINSDKSYIFGAPYTYHRYIRGYLPKGKTDYKVRGTMPDPELFTAQYLCNLLETAGVVINKPATTIRILNDSIYLNTTKTIITKTFSPALSEIIYQLNKKSINLFAESILVHIGILMDTVNDTKSSTDALVNFWAGRGLDTEGISINDGCGLSQYNGVSPKQLVYVLKTMYNQPKNIYEAFFNSLPIAGKDGTLSNVGDGTIIEGRINAKSGSIRGVRCYAGYATTLDGKTIAFAMMLNNFTCSDSKARLKLTELMQALVEYKESN